MNEQPSVLVLDFAGYAESDEASAALDASLCQVEVYTDAKLAFSAVRLKRPDLIALCTAEVDDGILNLCAGLEHANPDGRVYTILVTPAEQVDPQRVQECSIVYFAEPPTDWEVFARQVFLMALTGRKAGVLESALRDSNTALRAVDSSSCTIDIATESCAIAPPLLRLLEIPAKDQQSFYGFVHWRTLLPSIYPDDRAAMESLIQAALKTGQGMCGDVRLALKPDIRIGCTITVRSNGERQAYQLHLTWHRLAERTSRQRDIQLSSPEANLQQLTRLGETMNSLASGSILFVRLDDYSAVCKTLGFMTGQKLLEQVRERVLQELRATDRVLQFAGADDDRVARIGGAELVVLLSEIADQRQLGRIRQRVCQALQRPIILDGRAVPFKAAVGMAIWPQDGLSPDDLLTSASIAADEPQHSYEAPQGMDRTQQKIRAARDALRLEADLYDAISNQELKLLFQPKYSLATGAIAGVEALLRWHQNHSNWVSPDVFIPIAERNGLINTIGAWVIDEAIRTHASWRDDGFGDIPMAINISAYQLNDPGTLNQLVSICNAQQVACENIELEITESCLMEDAQQATRVLSELSRAGFKIALDDFGTGFSSLSYLRTLPLDVLKIDRSFVSSLCENDYDPGLIVCIIGLGLTLGLSIVAEGVETEAQWQMLGEWGCHYGQGFLMSKPISAEKITDLLQQGYTPGAAAV